MKLNKICRRSFIMALALVAVFALAVAWPSTAAAAGAPECGLIGTWWGDVGGPLQWLGVHTPGTTITRGQMTLSWLRVNKSLLRVYGILDGKYYAATRLSDGHGVWEQIARGEFKYTWYAYGIVTTASQDPIYSVRVSGHAKNMEFEGFPTNACDTIVIDWTYEVFDGYVLPQLMGDAEHPRVFFLEGPQGGIQMRVPLTVVPLTP